MTGGYSDDLSRFKQTYFDECSELLAVAEAGLLRLSPQNIDLDEINAVFRAVHSIKGGGGTFGFSDLVTFTHEFEAVMDRLRSQQIGVTIELVDVLIRANDVMAQLLTCARDNRPTPAGLTDTAAADLKRFLAAIKRDEVGPARSATNEAAAPPQRAPQRELLRSFVIYFRPKQDLLLSGNEPAFLLRALKRLGETEIVCDPGLVPSLYEMEGESLYLYWQISLVGSTDEAAIRDVFEFVVDDCQVDIVETTGPADGGEEEAFGLFTENMPYMPPGQLTVYDGGPGQVAGEASVTASPARPAGDAGGGAGAGLGGHTIRVDLDKVDRLVNLVGEMVITQAMIAEQLRDVPPGTLQQLVEGLEELSRHTRELQESVMAIRAQQVRSGFSRMPRLVREVAAQTGKEVQLATSGETTEVDKTVVENLVDPLTHMIRNSIDHGLESPDERERIGKPRSGTVHLSARHRSGRIVIEVEDDGRGINRPRVLEKAVERGLVAAGVSMSDEEIDNLIFLPGFSTVDTVSAISGRGVGMDVVRRNIASLGGRIVVHSTPGQGTRFVLSLPLTLAVLDGMVISVGEQRFVLPLTNIIESLRPKSADIQSVANQYDVIMARGEYVRLIYVDRLFRIDNAIGDPTRGLVVLVETEEGGRLGLVVDEVLGQQQVVIKSLESNFQRLDGVSAATILGDGRVALILDVAGLQTMSRQNTNRGARRPLRRLPARELETMETGTSVALPNAARGQIGSVASGPIAAEEQYVTFTVGTEDYGVNILSVREIRGWTPETKLPNMPDFVRGVVNLRGIIIPIFDLRARFGGGSTEVTRRHVVVVLQVGERTRGILVDAISDILTVARDDVKPPPDIDSGLIDQQYLSGLVTAENRMVTLLDVTRLFAGEAGEEIASSSIQIPHQAQA